MSRMGEWAAEHPGMNLPPPPQHDRIEREEAAMQRARVAARELERILAELKLNRKHT